MEAATDTSFDPKDHASAPPFPPGRYLDLPGRGVTFIRDQPGPTNRLPIVLLHGWTVTADLNFFQIYTGLATTGRVIAMDQRGHGRGIASNSSFRLEDAADDVAAMLDVLGIPKAVIVGYSMGGAVAQLTAHRHPDRVGGLVLCATSCRFRRSTEKRFVWDKIMPLTAAALSWTPEDFRHNLMERFVLSRNMAPLWMREQAARNDPAAMVQAGVAIGLFDASSWIGELPMPVASVITLADTTVPTRWQRATAKRAHAQMFEVQADHRAAVSEPKRFVRALISAINSVSR
jgi:3-oxoadipate enol-lactonase